MNFVVEFEQGMFAVLLLFLIISEKKIGEKRFVKKYDNMSINKGFARVVSTIDCYEN